MDNFAIYSTNAVYRKAVEMIVSELGLNCLISESFDEHLQSPSDDVQASILIIDIFSRGAVEHIITALRQFFPSSRLVFIISKKNPLINYFAQKFGAFDILFVEESEEELRESIARIINATTARTSYGTNGLTMRECEVLRLIALGKTSREIADELFISKNTVDTHRNKMLQKLNLSNSASLVTFACNAGLL